MADWIDNDRDGVPDDEEIEAIGLRIGAVYKIFCDFDDRNANEPAINE